MNVNKENPKRTRRTPTEARALILDVAASRLGELGLEGLNISGVAKAAGMSHATAIHHFGSTGAMREALLQKMTGELLSDIVNALAHHESVDSVLKRLFNMLSQNGHGRLLAWLALDQQLGSFNAGGGDTKNLFNNILDAISVSGGDRQHAKQQVFLVAIAALGLGICGDSIASLVGMNDAEVNAFPGWLAEQLQTL